MTDTPPAGLTDDAFLGGELQILQPAKGYRSGLDAVLLAAAAPIEPAGTIRVLDAGAGVGVVGLSIAARCPGARVTLVELDADLAGLARENARRNHLDHRVTVAEADVAAGGRGLRAAPAAAGLQPGSFDHLVTNPPYYVAGTGTPSAQRIKAASHQMSEGSLDGWIAFLATAGRNGATLTLIHRADALPAVLGALENRFGRIRVVPVHPRDRMPATRIIVTAVKGSRAPFELRPGLILHDAENHFMPDVATVQRCSAALAIW